MDNRRIVIDVKTRDTCITAFRRRLLALAGILKKSGTDSETQSIVFSQRISKRAQRIAPFKENSN